MKLKFLTSVVILLVSSFLLAGCNLPLIHKTASLQVLSSPRATVMLNNKIIGETPFFNSKIKPGDYNLKLIPIGQGDNILPYQTELKLKNGLRAALNWNFGLSIASSSGYLMTQEVIADKNKAMLMIVSEPTGAVVKLDGQNIGSTPLQKENLSPKQYNIEISAPGYKSQEIVASVEAGYKLIIKAKLAEGGEEKTEINQPPEATPSATPTPANQKKIEVLKTPTGWLRVRSQPSIAGKELTKVHPGDKFVVLDKKNGWYKIEYQSGKTGWVSGGYVRELTEEQSKPTPTPTVSKEPTPSPSPTND